MRILIGYSACPLTQAAFEAKGHDVYTCDLLPPRDASRSDKHFQCDIWDVARERWDMGIFHPMCTFLTISAAWAFADPDFVRYPEVGYHQKIEEGTLVGAARRAARDEALDNFRALLALPYPKAIENPAPSFVSKAIRPPDQTIQPFMFGDDASKRTGLWLDRLRKLRPSGFATPRMVGGGQPDLYGFTVPRWSNQTDAGQNRLSPGEERWLERSATYPGIARAFAEAWG
ncbi:MAG: hypothetical protein E6Q77_07575 [Rhizobium sp.]|nr:MAG: hypothetical protein E6Q77_07575 [Rhizobium sp.]